MKTTWLVLKHEIVVTLSRRSFWIMTFVFPLIILVFSVLPQLVAGDDLNQNPFQLQSSLQQPVGYVDEAGIITSLPPGMAAGAIRAYASTAAAQQALDQGAISRYLVYSPDFMQTGQVDLVTAKFNALGGAQDSYLAQYLVDYNLIGDAGVAAAVINPTANVSSHSLAPVTNQTDSALGFAVPFATMFILFFIISFTGGYMLQSVAREKEDRTVEVLLVSLRPHELMLGKILGLGLVGLLQMALWLGGSLFALNRGASMLSLPTNFSLPPMFVVLTIVYFLLGYLMYASALGALGALAPNAREGAQFTFLFILPLLLPFWLSSAFTTNPAGGVALIFSLIPLTAPTAMVARLAVTAVPLWQMAVSLVGLILTTAFFVMLAARFFRADTLLTSNSLNFGRLVREVRGALSSRPA